MEFDNLDCYYTHDFLGRIHRTMVLKKLSKEDMKEVVQKIFKRKCKKYTIQNLNLTDDGTSYVLEKSCKDQGIRKIESFIDTFIVAYKYLKPDEKNLLKDLNEEKIKELMSDVVVN